MGLNFEKKPDDHLIYDECDTIMFEEPGNFNQFTSKNPCICFTATPRGEDNHLETKMVEYMGFKVVKD